MLLDLAEHRNDGYIALKDIAARQEISKKYLEQIVALLGSSNMLRANRGAQGGYMLARDPAQYTVGEILRFTEGDLYPVPCMENEPNQCQRSSFCQTLPIWTGLSKVINEYLDNITLQRILDDYTTAGADEYYI